MSSSIAIGIHKVTLTDFKIVIDCKNCNRSDEWLHKPKPEEHVFTVSFGCSQCKERLRVQFWRSLHRYEFKRLNE